jgi:hypothetical protein
MDLKRENGITNQIEYSVFSNDGTEISLTECSGYSITTSNPLNLDNVNLNSARINKTSNEGYDIFNADDDFYTDLCTPFTNENGIDVPMNKRKSDYYQSYDFCEDGCSYISFNVESYKVNCSCSVKTSMSSEVSDTFVNNSISSNSKFYEVFDNSNILVVKCFKLVFSKKGFNFNWGSYFALLIISIQICLTVSYIIIRLKPLKIKIEKFSRKNTINLNDQSMKSNEDLSPNSNNNLKDKNDVSIQNINQHNKNIINKDEELPANPIMKSNNNLNEINDKNNNNELVLINNSIDKKENENKSKQEKNKVKETYISNASTNYQNYLFDDEVTINGYSHEELNNMEYDEAIKYDTRKFLDHYFSILRYDQLIIFTFFNFKDYNHEIFKFSLFFWSILMYLTFNALFFVDSTMNKIYEENGSLQFISALPKTIFSTLSCAIITFLLKFLTLSQSQMQKIKDEKELIKQKEKAESFERCFKIKVIIFFIIIFMLLIIFWYYLSAFCAVYKNTQKHLFKDSAISFCLSMIYPFFICLAASIFRFWSFNKKSKCLYMVSKIIQIF